MRLDLIKLKTKKKNKKIVNYLMNNINSLFFCQDLPVTWALDLSAVTTCKRTAGVGEIDCVPQLTDRPRDGWFTRANNSHIKPMSHTLFWFDRYNPRPSSSKHTRAHVTRHGAYESSAILRNPLCYYIVILKSSLTLLT